MLELFLALQRQWRVVAGFAGLQFFGFGSADIEAEMRMRHLKDRASLLDGVRVMERAALPIMNEKRDG